MRELDEIRKRIDAATPGPWRIIEKKFNSGMLPFWIVPGNTAGDYETYDGDLIVGDLGYTDTSDSILIANSRTDMDRMERALRDAMKNLHRISIAENPLARWARRSLRNIESIMRGEK